MVIAMSVYRCLELSIAQGAIVRTKRYTNPEKRGEKKDLFGPRKLPHPIPRPTGNDLQQPQGDRNVEAQAGPGCAVWV